MLWFFFNGGDNFSHKCNGFMLSPAFSFDSGLDREVLKCHMAMASSSRAAPPLNI